MPEQSINEQTRQMMGMPTSGDPAIIDPTTGRPYTPDASVRQQEEITRQAEVKEEFNLLQDEKRADVRDEAKISTLLETPETENLAEEITEDLNQLKDPLSSIRPKVRPKELEQKVGKLYQSAVKKAIELDYISKEEGGEEFDGYRGTKSNLRELEPKNLPTITKFITQALGVFDPNQDVTKAGVYWCAAFVNHILTEMGADTLGKGDRYRRLRAQEYINYGQEISFDDMQEGDILLFGVPELGKVTHVGFYTGERDGEYVNMLGGNQRSEKSLGELVNIVPRSLKDIVGVRRVTYDGDAAKIIKDQKGDNSIFRYFDTDTYSASFIPSESRKYNEGGDVAAQTDNLFGYTDEAVTKEVDKYKEDVNTELSFKDAATFVAEATPIIGDALAAKEVYDELQKDDPNYLLVGALGGAALVGLIPGLGDAAASAIKTGAKKVLDTAKRIEVDPNALGSMGGNITLKGGVGTGLPKVDMIADTPAGINNKTVTQSAVDLMNEPAFGKGFAEKLQKVAAENSIAVGDKTFSPMQVYTELKDRVGSDDFTVVPSKPKAANSPDELKNYAYRTDNPATKGYEGGEEWLEGKKKTAEDRAKNSSEENSTGKLLSGSITGYMGQDFKRPLFLSTEMLSKLKGANDEKRYVGEGRYDLLRKRVDKEGFDPEQKYSSEDDYGNAIVIGVNHKGEAFIIEGNTRVAVAKDLDVPSVRAEVKYYNGAEEVDGPYSPQNIIQYANKPKDFNKGGAVMNEQMEMAFMQQGGLKDDGMKRDPVSGNEVPNGSMAKEVRDDIPAQLSEGEYVVPADVVRYLGVKHFEDLRNKAKSGLQNMEANGRIGGEPVPVGGPRAAPMPYMAEGGDLTPDEMNEIKMLMSQGGMIAGAAEGADFGQKFMTQPSVYGGGFSWEDTPGGTPSGVSIADPELPTETPESCELRGMVYNPETKMCEVPIEASPVGISGGDDSSVSDDEGEDSTTWMDSYDYTNFNNLAQQTSAALDGPTTMLGSAAEMIFGGGVLGKLAKASNAAQVAANIAVLKAQADTDPSLEGTVAELTTKFNNYVSSNNLGGLKNFITGKNLAKQINKTQVDVGLFEDSTDVFGNKIFKDKDEFNKQLQDNAPAGMIYTPDQGAYIRPEGVSAAPSTSIRPEGGFAAAKAAATPVSKPADQKVPTPTSYQPTAPSGGPGTFNVSSNRDPGPSGTEVARAAAASSVARNEGVSAPTSGGARSVSDPNADTRGTGNRETYASKVQRGGGFNKGGLASRPKKKK